MTSSKLSKIRLLADHLRELDPESLRLASTYLSGRPFSPSDPRVLGLGGAAIVQVIERLSGRTRDELAGSYLQYGDLGEWAERALEGRSGNEGDAFSQGEARLAPTGVGLIEVNAELEAIREETDAGGRIDRLAGLLGRLDPLGARYLVKILTGELRIGLQEGLIEEAIAAAFEVPAADVRRAHMLTGDLGVTAQMARRHELATAAITLMRPIRYMLATAVATPDEALERMGGGPVWTEEKYDGVRCQLHRRGGEVALYSRDLRETTAAFPELVEAAVGFAEDLVIDGEVLGHRAGRVLRFFELQRRLGRKVVDAKIRAAVPVVLVVFDLLQAGGQSLLELPLRERRRRLEELSLPFPFLLARYESAATAEDLDRIFTQTRARGNEGLMLKDPESAYSPGRRGMAWLKLKRPLATLDVVVTAVEWGHGKRRGVLSDYTFAVRDDARGELVNIGKAYTGLTDAEIAVMTGHFLAHTITDTGWRRIVEPDTVIEVAFDSIQHSGRHRSGYALRFPRIVRLREDKGPDEIDTMDQVRTLHDRFFGAAATSVPLEEIAQL